MHESHLQLNMKKARRIARTVKLDIKSLARSRQNVRPVLFKVHPSEVFLSDIR